MVVKCRKCDVEVVFEISRFERAREEREDRCDLPPSPIAGTRMRVLIPVKVTIPDWCCPDMVQEIEHAVILQKV